ncbi:DsrE family protein [Psychromarinibacter sp. C21-152]|uniref:DsrE family protein n=1 Tax=Psychromarinibacter sediminicola TaxID=3033385 RepID=A0AAE3NNE2_9RHOB|nr:DsrE family protein [Psychromarinibacter sediminicola]MDF0599156.1 DsrE family protein [Psychromarinibacter sediminicola]
MKRLALAAVLAGLPMAALAEGKTHYVAFHIDDSDKRVMNMVLNNVQNTANHYRAQGDSVVIEVVAYGPGLQMYVDGGSPVADRIAAMSLELDDITFSACGNTHRKMSEKAGAEVALLDEAGIVPSGVVRLVELQEAGFAYVRP